LEKKSSAAPAPDGWTNLEILVLAAIRAGVWSAYTLNARLGLSVAATLPLLARLERQGLVGMQTGGRNSRNYFLTDLGQKVLRTQWRKQLLADPAEFEGVLRLAYLASVMEPEARVARKFLLRAAVVRRERAGDRARDAKLIAGEPVSFGRGHRWLRAFSESARLRSEATVLSKLATRRNLPALLASTETPA
jgi:DNA-binding PadR family transcriptional regulator